MDVDAPQIDVKEAHRRLERGEPLIDVREPGEYSEVHIPGSQLLPMSEFMERYEAELPREQELMIQCRSGSRSDQVAKVLLQRGYRAVNVAGGILAWESAGLPVEREDDDLG